MTNKPMLSVERELLEDFADYADKGKVAEPYMAQKLRALIDKSAFVDACPDAGLIPAELVALLRADLRESIEAAKLWLASNANGAPVEEGHLGCVATAIEMLRLGDSRDQIAGDFLDKTAAQNQGEPVVWVECSPAWLKAGGDCAKAPRICVGREGISHLHPAHSNAEPPAPVADHTQCEECKGWGYHENHHEGGGTECGECGGSGKAPVKQFSGDTVVCRRYQLEQHPGQNFYHYDLEPVHGSVPVTISELITMVESAPVAVVLPDRLKTEPFTTIDRGSKNYKSGYNAAIAEVAKLNGLKP